VLLKRVLAIVGKLCLSKAEGLPNQRNGQLTGLGIWLPTSKIAESVGFMFSFYAPEIANLLFWLWHPLCCLNNFSKRQPEFF